MTDAKVVCKELGCGEAIEAPKDAHFGEGSGQIWLDDMLCTGNESTLMSCGHPRLGTHNCGHHQDAGAVCSGVLHFLYLCCFVWMSIEALLLFSSVRKLRQVKPNDRAGPHWGYKLLIGYGVPLVIVAVSAGVMPDGYGSQQCWLKTDYGFIWSFLGPVCLILAGNIILFIAIIVTLQSTLKEAHSDVSKVKYTRVLLFKIMAQFVILGCPWILGMFTAKSKVLEFIFIILTSQQGTFIFLVHCLLNDEVRRQYKKWWQEFSPPEKRLSATAT
ncbi:adhesion G protein-coupled receptor E1-like [Alosa alosa]|uniref:adhesion G protein-coupled receptor E1-like n=1 Tax=Alosa alosa TaxID=278164 RepID=UPI0020150EB0|nr:adhesion G protein-coupled receptor E1-like [Alosa alosa]